jgi:1,6-anhydro-N-acetylmuramate kinase
MTGTSLDGLDVAVARVNGEGLDIDVTCLGMLSRPFGSLRETLRSLAAGNAHTPLELARAARQLGALHAQAVADLLEQLGLAAIDFIVAHGQTIHHQPDEHLSVQLLDPWPIARALGCPVLYDLRQADLIAGGQGAPITPLADYILFRDRARPRMVVNLGGICNVTELGASGTPDQIRGYDLCPCNLLIDGLVQRLFPGRTFDDGGAIALQGKADPIVRALMHDAPFFQRNLPRTTGREDFNDAWLDQLAATATRTLGADDVIASAVDAVAADIADAAPRDAQLILAGGGAHNRALVAAVTSRCDARLSDDVGIPVAAREAIGFAVLGALSQDGIAITLPQITGADRPGRAGAWIYPQ